MALFRKKKSENNTRVTITIDSETKKEITKISKETGYSFSAIASSMLDREVDLEAFIRKGGEVTLQYDGRTKQLRPYVDEDDFFKGSKNNQVEKESK
jgi:hypothetical protein